MKDKKLYGLFRNFFQKYAVVLYCIVARSKDVDAIQLQYLLKKSNDINVLKD